MLDHIIILYFMRTSANFVYQTIININMIKNDNYSVNIAVIETKLKEENHFQNI